MRRDPHGYWWMLFLLLTPAGWCLAWAFWVARAVRDALRKGTR